MDQLGWLAEILMIKSSWSEALKISFFGSLPFSLMNPTIRRREFRYIAGQIQ